MPELFREDQPITPLPLALLVGMALVEVYVALGVPGLPRAARIVQWVAAGVFLLASLIVRRLSIRVTKETVTWGFGPFRKHVRRSEISSVRIVEASIAKTGIGVHRIAGGLWAWVARTGPAVEILLSGGRVPGYIISTSHPRDLKAVLLEGERWLGASAMNRPISYPWT